MSNMALYDAGPIRVGDPVRLPVFLESDAGAEVLGVAYSAITVQVCGPGSSVLATVTMVSGNWISKGHGLYELYFDSGATWTALSNAEGPLLYFVQTTASGNKHFRGTARVQARKPERVAAAGNILIGQTIYLPVYLEDSKGNPLTGITTLSSLQVAGVGGLWSTISGTLTERGLGLYQVAISAGYATNEGPLFYAAASAGSITYRGVVMAVNPSTQYEVFTTICYEPSTTTITILCWLHLNGVIVTAPTSCQVILKEEGVTEKANEISASPNADGVFKMTEVQALNANKTHTCKARVTYGGVEYTSVDGQITLN